MRLQLAESSDRILADLNRIMARLKAPRNEYLISKVVFGFYIDLLDTRALM
jgi:hypothetical protein